jgi:hypothetical protein
MIVLYLRCLFSRRYADMSIFKISPANWVASALGHQAVCAPMLAFEHQWLMVWYLRYVFRKYVNLSSVRNLTADGMISALHPQKVRAAVYLKFNCWSNGIGTASSESKWTFQDQNFNCWSRAPALHLQKVHNRLASELPLLIGRHRRCIFRMYGSPNVWTSTAERVPHALRL